MKLWVIVELNQSVGAEQMFTIVGPFERLRRLSVRVVTGT